MSPFPFFRPADTRRRSARTSTDWSGWLLIILSLLGVMGAAAQTSPVVLRPALVATQAGAALQFNGQRDQGVVVPELPGSPFNFQGNYTVEAWVYVTSWTSRYQAIITKGDAWGIVRADESPNIAFRTARLGPVGGFHDLISPLPFPTGKWTHVAAVWNGQHKLLYVNGLLVGQQAYADGVLAVNFPVMIGGNAETNKADRTLNGIVDSVRIWGAARTGEELEIYNSENLLVAANLRGNEPGLLADWRFDEGAGTVARDSSAEGMHATLVPSKLVGQPGVLPQWVNGLALAPPPPGTLAIFFKNRTAQYGITGAGAAIQQVTFPQLEWPEQAGLRDGLTAEFWINPAAIPATGEVVLLSNGAEAWEVRYHHTGKIGFFTHQVQSTLPGGGNEQLSTARVEPLGWTHVAVVWDPAALEKRIYLNGELDATTPVQVMLGAVWTPTEPVSIGAPTLIVSPLDRAFYGTLDELRLWSYVRPAADVVEDHLRRVDG